MVPEVVAKQFGEMREQLLQLGLEPTGIKAGHVAFEQLILLMGIQVLTPETELVWEGLPIEFDDELPTDQFAMDGV